MQAERGRSVPRLKVCCKSTNFERYGVRGTVVELAPGCGRKEVSHLSRCLRVLPNPYVRYTGIRLLAKTNENEDPSASPAGGLCHLPVPASADELLSSTKARSHSRILPAETVSQRIGHSKRCSVSVLAVASGAPERARGCLQACKSRRVPDFHLPAVSKHRDRDPREWRACHGRSQSAASALLCCTCLLYHDRRRLTTERQWITSLAW